MKAKERSISMDMGGSLRYKHPDETLNAIQPLIKKAGITRIANLTGLDILNVPVYTCIRPESKSLSASQGKGLTHKLAKCSAFMEAIEHYYAENVETDEVCKIGDIPSNQLIDTRYAFNGLLQSSNFSNIDIEWSRTYNLHSGDEYYIPTDLISLDLTKSNQTSGLIRVSSTGLASGNNTKEALCHGLYECLERHATYKFKRLTNANKNSKRLKIDSIDTPHARKLLKSIGHKSIDIAIFDLTTELKVPTYYCILADIEPYRDLGHFGGYGAHLNKDIALTRAITEAAQSRLTYIAGSRDDMLPDEYKKTWSKLSHDEMLSFCNEQNHVDDNINNHINHLLTRLKSFSFDQVLLHEHTTEDIPISVVRVVIPGLSI